MRTEKKGMRRSKKRDEKCFKAEKAEEMSVKKKASEWILREGVKEWEIKRINNESDSSGSKVELGYMKSAAGKTITGWDKSWQILSEATRVTFSHVIY